MLFMCTIFRHNSLFYSRTPSLRSSKLLLLFYDFLPFYMLGCVRLLPFTGAGLQEAQKKNGIEAETLTDPQVRCYTLLFG